MSRLASGTTAAQRRSLTAPDDRTPSVPDGDGGRADHAFLIPVTRLFYPEPDPTERFPEQTASVDGYVVGPGRVVTIALAVSTPSGAELLDAVWAALHRKGVGVRQLTVLNDRGRIISLMTVRVDASERMLRALESLLLVPVRTHNGFAEVHLLATPTDLGALKGTLQGEGLASPPPTLVPIPPFHDSGVLIPQDWAFLGLLSSVGAFDGPHAVAPAVLAEALGIDLDAFVERARAAERGLHGLVTGLFGPVAGGKGPSAVPT